MVGGGNLVWVNYIANEIASEHPRDEDKEVMTLGNLCVDYNSWPNRNRTEQTWRQRPPCRRKKTILYMIKSSCLSKLTNP